MSNFSTPRDSPSDDSDGPRSPSYYGDMTYPTVTPQSDRRAEVVRAAIRAFARKGYGGTTLADIAVEAGVSQPRISQIFGNKETAFLQAQQVASDEVLEVLGAHAGPPYSVERIAAGYRPMIADRPEILQMVIQMMTSSYVPSIREASQRYVNEIIRLVTEQAGGTMADAVDLLSRGFFFNAMLLVDAHGSSESYPEMNQALEAVSRQLN